MITITRSQFENLKNNHSDYFSKAIKTHTHDGKTCHAGKDYCGFASVITGDAKQGTTLIFEHIHFEIEGR